jgi:hypothetical protein
VNLEVKKHVLVMHDLCEVMIDLPLLWSVRGSVSGSCIAYCVGKKI